MGAWASLTSKKWDGHFTSMALVRMDKPQQAMDRYGHALRWQRQGTVRTFDRGDHWRWQEGVVLGIDLGIQHSFKSIAPNLYKHYRRKKRAVAEALQGDRWVDDIRYNLSITLVC